MSTSSATNNRIAQTSKVKQGDYQLAGRSLFALSDTLGLVSRASFGLLNSRIPLPWFNLVSQGFYLQLNRHRLSVPGGFNWAYVASGAGVA